MRTYSSSVGTIRDAHASSTNARSWSEAIERAVPSVMTPSVSRGKTGALHHDGSWDGLA
jgi:hypothetical protein